MIRWALALVFILVIASSFAIPLTGAQPSGSKYDLIIVRNDNPIDYIVALPYSKMLGIPILPVNPKELDTTMQAQLQSYAQFGWNHVLIIGDSKAVSDTVQDQLMSLGFIPERIGGAVRTQTAARLAEYFYPNGTDTVVIASASDYGSALAAARFAMNYDYPLLLNPETNLSVYTEEALQKLKPSLVILVGAGLPANLEQILNSLGYHTYWYKKNVEITIKPQVGAKETDWTKIIIAVILSLAVAVPGSLYYARKKWAENRVPIEVLTEKERIVVRAIVQKGGEVKQEDLPELTGYSRPTISRIIQELEKKQLVTREKVGKTFTVKLTKDIIMRD
ncbi:cell wall-binding repeat-containing protein [Thermococcus sp.]|uniref:cell wall-binding repeat-containing protein n=1 Tax=Thermococcus sp. TaxID=35749 RepID=UPI0025F7D73D|nr:cell wall-binding repeat-containing protein [Thermococcus sp.]